ncbi:hypothetical protein B0H14DRAFT_2829543 [Mycena olivaceomarginata]|nr:hypothetical protein B0H14DRAFT_2829543 [Mycena olivaceomarginata]
MRRWLVPSGARGTRSRQGLMPASPSNNEEHTRLHVLLSTRPWDAYAYDRHMPCFIAGGGHEQDALLAYNSRTQGSEPCCRLGQPKSVRGYMGVMQEIHPREYRERNDGSRPRAESGAAGWEVGSVRDVGGDGAEEGGGAELGGRATEMKDEEGQKVARWAHRAKPSEPSTAQHLPECANCARFHYTEPYARTAYTSPSHQRQVEHACKRRGLRKERGHTKSDASASATAVVLLPASSLLSDQNVFCDAVHR